MIRIKYYFTQCYASVYSPIKHRFDMDGRDTG